MGEVVSVGIPGLFGLTGAKTAYKDENVLLGEAQAINFVGDGVVATLNEGVLTVEVSSDILTNLKIWAYAESFAVISATRDANNVITSANIKWPDGVSGVFTIDAINATFNTIDAWHATYLDTVTKTVTQTTVTRNADGAVTAQPEITVS
jgi:hypothetical protein